MNEQVLVVSFSWFAFLAVYDAGAEKAKSSIINILKNLLQFPNDKKYKNLNYNKISKILGKYEICMNILECIGFKISWIDENCRFILHESAANIDKMSNIYDILSDIIEGINIETNENQCDIVEKLIQSFQLNTNFISFLKPINHCLVYKISNNNPNNNIVWRPNIKFKTNNGYSKLYNLVYSKAVQNIVKQNNWTINTIIELIKPIESNKNNDTYTVGYNSGKKCEKREIGIYVGNRKDYQIFVTFTHELAHMKYNGHTKLFYDFQEQICRYILKVSGISYNQIHNEYYSETICNKMNKQIVNNSCMDTSN
eukprot:372911_1